MKRIIGTATFCLDFTESVLLMNEDREREGEPLMTEEEIEDYIREDLLEQISSDLKPDIEMKIEEGG